MVSFTLWCLFLVTCCYGAWEQEFDHSTYLDSKDEYKLFWTILNDTHIEIGLQVEAIGWIAIGLSTNGQMINSDIIIGWIENDENNTVILQNRYTLNERVTPFVMNEQTNIELIEGFQNDNMTYLRFTRLLFPCNENSIQIPRGTAKVIYAYNKFEKPVNNEPLHHDNNRGNKAVNLLQGETIEVEMPNDVKIFDAKMNNYTLPALDTIYYCKLIKLPETINNSINHIIRFDPIIDDGNEGIVHHMVLMYCPEIFLSEQDKEEGFEGECNELANMGFTGAQCQGSTLVTAWAVGGHPFYFPQHVGYEFGGNKSDAMKYLLLNMHYDNPDKLSNIIDSSGMRLYYTAQLREYSASSLIIGNTVSQKSIFIPPRMDSAFINGYCLSECLTEDNIGNNGSGITAFANLLHSHTIGKSMKLRHIRNGIEFKYLDINEQYDFDYQQVWILPNEITIFPGDQLIMECEYDSTDRINMTFGGEATYEEMCFSYLYIYPKVDLVWCTTSFLDESLYEFWNNAKQNGFANGNISNNYIDFNDVYYNATSKKAIDFYNSLHQNTNLRKQLCRDNLLNDLKSGIVETQFEFDEYELIDICHQGSSSKGNKWESWNPYVIVIIAGITALAICIFIARKLCNKYKANSFVYQRY